MKNLIKPFLLGVLAGLSFGAGARAQTAPVTITHTISVPGGTVVAGGMSLTNGIRLHDHAVIVVAPVLWDSFWVAAYMDGDTVKTSESNHIQFPLTNIVKPTSITFNLPSWIHPDPATVIVAADVTTYPATLSNGVLSWKDASLSSGAQTTIDFDFTVGP